MVKAKKQWYIFVGLSASIGGSACEERSGVEKTVVPRASAPVGTDGTSHSSKDLLDAVNNGDIAAVGALCEAGVDVDAVNDDGMAALHRAATKGHADIARLLLERGARLDPTDKRGWTPLHIAAMLGRTSVVQLLLERGARRDAKDRIGKTPLDHAQLRQHVEVVVLLRGDAAGR